MKHRPEKLLDAAVLLYDEFGVEVSTAQVAKAAGVSNGTLFNYFPTKQDLFDSLYVTLKHELADAIGEPDESLDFHDQVKTIWDRWIEWGRNAPKRNRVALLLHQSGLASETATASAMQVFATHEQRIRKARTEGILADLPEDYLVQLIQQQIELAIAGELSAAQQQTAFNSMWRSITKAPESNGQKHD